MPTGIPISRRGPGSRRTPCSRPGFPAPAVRGADIGIYDRDVHHEHVVRPLVRALGEMGMPGLGPAGEQTGPRNGWAGTWSSCEPTPLAPATCAAG